MLSILVEGPGILSKVIVVLGYKRFILILTRISRQVLHMGEVCPTESWVERPLGFLWFIITIIVIFENTKPGWFLWQLRVEWFDATIKALRDYRLLYSYLICTLIGLFLVQTMKTKFNFLSNLSRCFPKQCSRGKHEDSGENNTVLMPLKHKLPLKHLMLF